MIRPAGLLLDLDRTLVDVQTFSDYEAAVATLPSDVRDRVDAGTPATAWRSATRAAMDILVRWSGSARWQEISDHIERFEREAVPESQLMPGVFEFLQAVAGTPIAVVTLMGPGAARAALDLHGIELPVVLGRAAGYRPKPAPDQPVAACAALGLAPAEVTMIGDSTWDGVAAAAAGCRFIGLTRGEPSEFPAGTTVVPWLDAAIPLVT